MEKRSATVDLAAMRREYKLKALDERSVAGLPIDQFHIWFQEAVNGGALEPNAMTLATVDAQGHPNARIVLLKGADATGFVFFTNYESDKGRELEANPNACMLFNWLELERQVRIRGRVIRIPTAESEAYFQSRPKGSQLGGWASPQSRVISDRSLLEKWVKEAEEKYKDLDVLPLPPHWGGYRLQPVCMEFWQGRESRLHDRIRYSLQTDGEWILERLAP